MVWAKKKFGREFVHDLNEERRRQRIREERNLKRKVKRLHNQWLNALAQLEGVDPNDVPEGQEEDQWR